MQILGYNIGTFIGYIVDQLEKILINNINKDNDINYFFFTLEEYNKEIINFHKIISNDYNFQNAKSFDLAYRNLSEYLNSKEGEKDKEIDKTTFLLKLMKFNDINNNFEEIINYEVLENINYFLQKKNYNEILEKLSYYIAGSMLAINKLSEVKSYPNLFEVEIKTDYNNLIKLKDCINKIIYFKLKASVVNYNV